MSDVISLRLTLHKRIKRIFFSLLISRLFLLGKKSRVTRLSAEFVFRMQDLYPTAKIFHSREKLWRTFGGHLGTNKWVGFEFGVAYGDLTKTFLKMPYIGSCVEWHGFDTFFGLPNEWGDLPKGAFSTNGKPPKLKSKLIKWHIGRIESTCEEISKLQNLNKNFVVIFDFDLYSASKVAWDAIVNYLKPGDIIYFDEAYESDENRLIEEILLNQTVFLEVIGYTTMGIAFEVKK